MCLPQKVIHSNLPCRPTPSGTTAREASMTRDKAQASKPSQALRCWLLDIHHHSLIITCIAPPSLVCYPWSVESASPHAFHASSARWRTTRQHVENNLPMVRPGSLMTDLRKPICGDLVTTFTSSELLVRQATQPWLVPADFPGPVRRPHRAIQSVVAGLSLVPTSDQRQHHHCHPHHCACCFTSINFPLTINVVLAAAQTLIRSIVADPFPRQLRHQHQLPTHCWCGAGCHSNIDPLRRRRAHKQVILATATRRTFPQNIPPSLNIARPENNLPSVSRACGVGGWWDVWREGASRGYRWDGLIGGRESWTATERRAG